MWANQVRQSGEHIINSHTPQLLLIISQATVPYRHRRPFASIVQGIQQDGHNRWAPNAFDVVVWLKVKVLQLPHARGCCQLLRCLWPSALTPPSGSSQSGSPSRSDANDAGQGATLWSPRLVLRLLRTCWQAVCVAPSCCSLQFAVCHALPPASRPFLTSDEAVCVCVCVAMFMCTLQNNWPRLGAQLALPGQLQLTALHTCFTLFCFMFSVFCFLFSFAFRVFSVLVNCPKALAAFGINGFSFRPPKKIVINFSRSPRSLERGNSPLDSMSILSVGCLQTSSVSYTNCIHPGVLIDK